MKKIKLLTILMGTLLFPILAVAQNVSDYLILQNIGVYSEGVKSLLGSCWLKVISRRWTDTN
jgi:hypothetical protein